MISEKRNKTFLYRINEILGDRDKHPWGRSIGLRNTRINAIFSEGPPPKADALIRISDAENVSIDWLLTGRGEPYLSPDRGSDSVCSAVLHAAMQDIPKGKIYLLYGPGGQSAVVITHKISKREDKDHIAYTAAKIYAPAGPKTIAELKGKGREVFYKRISADDLEPLKTGRIGYLHLMVGADDKPSLLDGAEPMDDYQLDIVLEDAASYIVTPGSQEQLLRHYQNVGVTERAALLTIVKSMDRTYEINQLPLNPVENPDLETECKTVAANSKVPSPDKIGTED